jgi:hypothetical protein
MSIRHPVSDVYEYEERKELVHLLGRERSSGLCPSEFGVRPGGVLNLIPPHGYLRCPRSSLVKATLSLQSACW